MTQLDLGFAAMPVRGISWERRVNLCRAHHGLKIDGRLTGFWVAAAQHPTAIRPYYVVSPTGEISARKFAHLVDAKAACIAWHEGGPRP